jgi:CubicO group peptidase (beta-lactamase class C family)
VPVPVEIAKAEGERAREIARHMQGLASLGYSGTVLIAEAGGPRLHMAFGWADRDPARPQTIETIQYWASIAKTVTAVTTMRLVEQGKLSLDDTVGQHFHGVPPDKSGISVRQLLSHTGGLATYHDEGVRALDRETALERILGSPLVSEPGGPASYSNSGYTLLALVLEAAAGAELRDLVASVVLDPAGMQSTVWVGESLPAPAAHGYENKRDRGGPQEWDAATWTILGAGGMVGPASDVFRFASAMFGGRILEPRSVQSMIAPKTGDLDPTGSADNALGWKTWRDDAGRIAVEKGGSSDKGFQGLLRVYPEEGLVLVLFLNTQDVPYLLGKDALANRLIRTWRGEAQAIPPIPAPAVAADGYLGEWGGESGALRIAQDTGWTRAEASGQELVDVLLAHDSEERSAARAANERAGPILAAAARGDLAPARGQLAPGRPEGVVEDLEAALEGANHAEVLGSSREFFRDAAGLVTYVRIPEAETARYTRLHWDPRGGLRAVGGSAFPHPVIAMLVPVGADRAVVHHPALGRSASVRLVGGALIVESAAGRVALDRR